VEEDRLKRLGEMKEKMIEYINKYFYKALRSLKYDQCETVREFMANLNIYSTRSGRLINSTHSSILDDTSSLTTVTEF
jgi:hypothetical protein